MSQSELQEIQFIKVEARELESNSMSLHRYVAVKTEPIDVVKKEHVAVKIEPIDVVKEEHGAVKIEPIDVVKEEHVAVKIEPIDVVKEDHVAEDLDLYADHEIKEEIVIEPVVLQTSVVVPENCAQSTVDKFNMNTRPYKCDICSKCFTRKRDLKRHIITHTGEKPYQCDICNKCFIRNSNLQRHIKTHTEEKPYQCDICNKCFLLNSQLKQHKMTDGRETVPV